MKKIRLFFHSAGHYVLALFCGMVILLSALWTRQTPSPVASPAQMNQSQRLSDITPSPAPELFHRPVGGPCIRAFSDDPVYFPEYRRYAFHPSADFSVTEGEKIYAAFDGTVRQDGDTLYLENDAFSLRYRGITPEKSSNGKQVRKGALLGTATGFVPYEGQNILCLTLYQNSTPVDISPSFAAKKER